MSERSGQEPQPEADDQRVAGTDAPGGAVPAAERAAGAMGNQAFGRALEAARGGDQQMAGLPEAFGMPAAPAMPAAQDAMDLGGFVLDAVEGAAEAVVRGARGAGAAKIDKAAVASRVTAIALTALNQWAAMSTIVAVRITGPSGFGGMLIGPSLTPFMRSASSPPAAEARVQAKALQGFAAAFQQWCAGFNIPGIPLWPSFAAIPMPVAPPTLAIPMPLAALCPAPFALTLVGDDDQEQEALNDAGTAMRAAFETWKASRMVSGLMGTGPVPSFAPPFIPVGPVAGGTGYAPPPAV